MFVGVELDDEELDDELELLLEPAELLELEEEELGLPGSLNQIMIANGFAVPGLKMESEAWLKLFPSESTRPPLQTPSVEPGLP